MLIFNIVPKKLVKQTFKKMVVPGARLTTLLLGWLFHGLGRDQQAGTNRPTGLTERHFDWGQVQG